ncbi:hypothetical protein [uncultured Rikenella sp.]|uniref:hypothetical protein n=1 Tax=uncultured Rikenella sp. TaxID=368003 RepID=UPI00272B4F31|nr:hypothetical protein [uncultured Rikenella sp.]
MRIKLILMVLTLTTIAGGSCFLYKKAYTNSQRINLQNLTLENIEAMSSTLDIEGTQIPCSPQPNAICYFRVWNAEGKYIGSSKWKNHINAAL